VRLVLDTDVVVAALRSPQGASAELLRRIERGRAKMLLSLPLALEYQAVCMLPVHRSAAGLSAAEVSLFASTLISLATPVEIHFRWRPMLHDPGDEMALETAVNGQADALVTFNQRHYKIAPKFLGIEVILPKTALERISK